MKSKELNKEEIKKLYTYWSKLKILKRGEAANRGYDLERILFSILSIENLEPISGYKKKGEQIDGSFFFFGQTFLLEAKWQKSPLPVSDIYSFKGKVDGKFHTTSGIFISISNFSNDVPDALRFGKHVNLLLFDKSDIDSIILKNVPFTEVLKFKIRQAGDTGNPYVNYNIKETAKDILESSPVISGGTITHEVKWHDIGVDLVDPLKPLFLVICVGKIQEETLKALFQRISFIEPVAFQFKAYKKENFLNVISSLLNLIRQNQGLFDLKGAVIFHDFDENSNQISRRFEEITKEELSKSAVSIEIKLLAFKLYSLKETVNRPVEPEIRKLVNELKRFINDKLSLDIDLEYEAAKESIERGLEALEWDFKNKTVIVPGEHKVSDEIIFDNIEDLRLHLEELADVAAINEVPWDKEFLDDRENPDFSFLVYDCMKKYEKNFKKLKWDL